MFKMFRSRIPADTENGFTLIEIMLVLAIIAILSSISMPAMRGFAASQRLKTSAQAIVDTISFARDMAITESATHLVVFDVDGNRYWLASSETFDVQNPVSSAGRASNAPTTPDGQMGVSRTSGIMGIPQPLSHGITIAGLVTIEDAGPQQINSGADYVYFTPISTSIDTIVYLQNVRGDGIAITVEGATGRAGIQQMTQEELQMLGFGGNL